MRAWPTGWHDIDSTEPATTRCVPLVTSAARSTFSGELGLKYGPSVCATVGWVSAPHEGVGGSEGAARTVISGAETVRRIDRPLLHAATNRATPAPSTARRETGAPTPTVSPQNLSKIARTSRLRPFAAPKSKRGEVGSVGEGGADSLGGPGAPRRLPVHGQRGAVGDGRRHARRPGRRREGDDSGDTRHRRPADQLADPRRDDRGRRRRRRA